MDLIKYEAGSSLLDPETAKKIAEWEKQVKIIKEKEDELKDAILKEMERKGILQIDGPELTITYVMPTYRETFDHKTLRKEKPLIYDEYCKLTPVKASIRIKVK